MDLELVYKGNNGLDLYQEMHERRCVHLACGQVVHVALSSVIEDMHVPA